MGQMADGEVRLLDLLGVTWKSRDVGTWEDRLAEVAAFKAKNGHCDIPVNYPENPKLGHFVNAMRTQRNNGKLCPGRVAKLEALGFSWGSRRKTLVGGDGITAEWQARFDELLCYKRKYGDCNLPMVRRENPQLSHWVSQQRQLRKGGTLHPERQRRLDEIGFDWLPYGRREEWSARFEQLKAYKEQFGNCRLPLKGQGNQQLGRWVSRQRELRRGGTLLPERQRRLDEIGFDWRADSRKEEWSTRFEQLKSYKARLGDCRVPVRWKENPQLGLWVANQRHVLKTGGLSPERERLLVEIGFE
jgi:hypothetical protein